MDFASQVIDRLRLELARKKMSYQDVADLLGWTQSRVSQKLNQISPTTLQELEGLCFAAGISKVEAVRDSGLEFVADMTPSELRILTRLRQLPRPVFDAIMTILRVDETVALEPRGATKRKPVLGPIRRRHDGPTKP